MENCKKRPEEVKDVEEKANITVDEVAMETEQYRPRRSARNRKCVCEGKFKDYVNKKYINFR